MKHFAAFLLAIPLLGQSAQYPSPIADRSDLPIVRNGARARLGVSLTGSATTVVLNQATNFGNNQVLQIESEYIFCTTLTGTIFTGCTRGFDGSTAASHAATREVTAPVIAWHLNALSTEIVAIETALGENLGNVSGGGGSGCTPPSGNVGDLLVYAAGGDCTATTAVTDAQVPNNITIDLATVATTANAGDSATAFFNSGTIEAARLPALSGLSGAVTDSQVPDTITVDLATAANALASNPTDCSAGQYANAIAANGNLTCSQVAYSQISSTPTLYNQTVEDEGTPVTQRSSVNFTGAGVSVADSGGKTVVTINGGGGGSGCETSGSSGQVLVDDGAGGCTSSAVTISSTTITATLSGNASTASALASNPSDCSSNQFANAIATNGNLTCGAIGDADVPNNITIDLAAAATALASNPTDCSSNQFATAIAANGNLTCGAITDTDVPDTITVSNYLPLAGGTLSGSLATVKSYSVLTTVSFSSTPTFNASLGNSFLITLTSNVTSSTLSNASTGQIITLRICQDGTGSHTFVEPTNVLNMAEIDGTANACSTQTFIYDGTNAQAIGVMLTTGGTPGIVIPGSSSGAVTLQAEAAAAGTVNLRDNSTTVAATTCSAQFARAITSAGAVTCEAIADADVPNNITVDVANAGDSATNFFSSGTIEDARLPSSMADKTITGSLVIPQGTNPTVDAVGKIGVDTTSGQFKVHDGTATRALPTLQYLSFVIPAPATSDDINLLKAPYGMSIVAINGIVQGTTSATGQLQECASDGTSCADLDSDITVDADGASDDGSLTDSTIASGGWLRWKTTSVSGTPAFLTVTVSYRVVAD